MKILLLLDLECFQELNKLSYKILTSYLNIPLAQFLILHFTLRIPHFTNNPQEQFSEELEDLTLST